MTRRTSTTGREYLRVSVDKSDRGRSVEEQHDDNARAALARGVALGKSYEDNNVSASRYTRKTRTGFDQLILDLESGEFGADELWLWEHSRGSRRVSEWVRLTEACEEAGVKIYVTTHGRSYDPANGRDRRSLLEDAVDSEYESSKVSERTKRAAAATAAAGRPSGRTPFGYRRIYDQHTRKLIRQEPDPETAPLIRELFDRANGGHSLRSIERDWAARGIVNGSGRPFSAQHLRTMLLTRAYVGDRVHNPGLSGGEGGRLAKPKHVVKGAWDPLVDEVTFFAVGEVLRAPERRTNRPGRGVHLLSMIAKCAVCMGKLAVRMDRPVAEYHCQRGGHVRINKEVLDEFAEAVMLDFLSDPKEYRKIAAHESSDADVRKAKAEVKRIEEELEDLARQLEAGDISATLAGRAERGKQKRLDAAQDRLKGLQAPARLTALIEPGPGVRERWTAAPMPTRREVARLLLSPDALGELRLQRRGPIHVPVDQRVEWERS